MMVKRGFGASSCSFFNKPDASTASLTLSGATNRTGKDLAAIAFLYRRPLTGAPAAKSPHWPHVRKDPNYSPEQPRLDRGRRRGLARLPAGPADPGRRDDRARRTA